MEIAASVIILLIFTVRKLKNTIEDKDYIIDGLTKDNSELISIAIKDLDLEANVLLHNHANGLEVNEPFFESNNF